MVWRGPKLLTRALMRTKVIFFPGVTVKNVRVRGIPHTEIRQGGVKSCQSLWKHEQLMIQTTTCVRLNVNKHLQKVLTRQIINIQPIKKANKNSMWLVTTGIWTRTTNELPRLIIPGLIYLFFVVFFVKFCSNKILAECMGASDAGRDENENGFQEARR